MIDKKREDLQTFQCDTLGLGIMNSIPGAPVESATQSTPLFEVFPGGIPARFYGHGLSVVVRWLGNSWYVETRKLE